MNTNTRTQQRKNKSGFSKINVKVKLSNVCYKYNLDEASVIGPIDLSIADGEVIAIVGPSGSGKSTLLNLVGGLLQPTAGSVQYSTDQKIQIGLAPQDPTLLPWLNLNENMTISEKIGLKQPIPANNTGTLLKRFGLQHKVSARPYELSGGMQSRAALARALVTEPEMLLLDEPFNSLDEITAERIIRDLTDSIEVTKPTTIFVSHNIAQAVFLADKVIILAGSPARIMNIVEVNLPRPRRALLLSTKAFQSLVSEVRELMQESAL